jgi:hypothetical protein
MHLLDSGTSSRFKTPDEAKNLAMLIAHAYPDPTRVVTGILELALNADRTWQLKYRLRAREIAPPRGRQRLEKEIARRLNEAPLFHPCGHRDSFYRRPGLTLVTNHRSRQRDLIGKST